MCCFQVFHLLVDFCFLTPLTMRERNPSETYVLLDQLLRTSDLDLLRGNLVLPDLGEVRSLRRKSRFGILSRAARLFRIIQWASQPTGSRSSRRGRPQGFPGAILDLTVLGLFVVFGAMSLFI